MMTGSDVKTRLYRRTKVFWYKYVAENLGTVVSATAVRFAQESRLTR
jgi:hypothetical protein